MYGYLLSMLLFCLHTTCIYTLHSHREYNGKQRHAEDVSLVLSRARAVGVTSCILTAGNIEESTRALNYITHEDPSTSGSSMDKVTTGGDIDNSNNEEKDLKPSLKNGLYSTVGVHPTRCNEFTEKGVEVVMEMLDALLLSGKESGKVVAVGEAGLDYDRFHFCEKEQQMIGFLKQIELAEK